MIFKIRVLLYLSNDGHGNLTITLFSTNCGWKIELLEDLSWRQSHYRYTVSFDTFSTALKKYGYYVKAIKIYDDNDANSYLYKKFQVIRNTEYSLVKNFVVHGHTGID